MAKNDGNYEMWKRASIKMESAREILRLLQSDTKLSEETQQRLLVDAMGHLTFGGKFDS